MRDRHVFIVLVIVLLLGTGTVLWFIGRRLEQQVKATAIHDANIYLQALIEFRKLYTSEVVSKVQDHIPVVHNYDEINHSIPLPATLSILLGNHIGKQGSGIKVRLYSPYPFPWRKSSGGLQDSFSKRAWAALEQNVAEPYFEFEEPDGRRQLRYAVADIMQKDCVRCHNSHAQSPKSNWEVGDVRGILEVIYPISSAQTPYANDFRQLRAVCFAILIISLFGFALMFLRLKKKQRQILYLTHIDPLTGLYNRRQLDIILNNEWKRSKREGFPFSLMIIDVDFFKSINDTYGHQRGDMSLKAIASVINQVLGRSSDVAIRYGGDEFVVLLPNTDLSGGVHIAEAIVTKVNNLDVKYKGSKISQLLTVSIGLATVIPNDSHKPEDLLAEADKMLYEAKEAGRNQLKSVLIKGYT